MDDKSNPQRQVEESTAHDRQSEGNDKKLPDLLQQSPEIEIIPCKQDFPILRKNPRSDE